MRRGFISHLVQYLRCYAYSFSYLTFSREYIHTKWNIKAWLKYIYRICIAEGTHWIALVDKWSYVLFWFSQRLPFDSFFFFFFFSETVLISSIKKKSKNIIIYANLERSTFLNTTKVTHLTMAVSIFAITVVIFITDFWQHYYHHHQKHIRVTCNFIPNSHIFIKLVIIYYVQNTALIAKKLTNGF